MSWLTALVIGRILGETGSPPPDVDDPAILLVKRKDVVIGCTPDDGGMLGDAATDAVMPDDALVPDAAIDAGPGDAGIGDAGVPDAAVDASTCTMIPGDAVTLVVQPHVNATMDGTHFAVLLVTPQRPIVELASSNVFPELARVTAPKIEEHIVEVPDSSVGTVCSDGCSDANNEGCGGGGYGEDPSWWDPPGVSDAGLGDGGIVEEMIGPYSFVRAQPSDAQQLAKWLDQLGYAYMQDDLDAVSPYIALGYHAVAIRVSLDRPLRAPIAPVALTWAGSELRVPAALGHGAPSAGLITVYIAAEQKYVLPNAGVQFANYTSGTMGAGYLTRMQLSLDQNRPPEDDPIAYVSSGTYVPVEIVEKEVRVPVEVSCEEDRGCCSDCNARPRARFDWLSVVAALAFVLRPRRRRKSVSR